MARSLFAGQGFFHVSVESEIKRFISDFEKHSRRVRIKAANHIKRKIKRKANKMKKSGNLEAGVYSLHQEDASFVGLRAPAHHAYLIEFGHVARDGSFVMPYPIVYPTFHEEDGEVERIMSEPVK